MPGDHGRISSAGRPWAIEILSPLFHPRRKFCPCPVSAEDTIIQFKGNSVALDILESLYRKFGPGGDPNVKLNFCIF